MERIDNNTYLFKNSSHIIHHFVRELLEHPKVDFATYKRNHFLDKNSSDCIIKLFCSDDKFQKNVLMDTCNKIIDIIEKFEQQLQ